MRVLLAVPKTVSLVDYPHIQASIFYLVLLFSASDDTVSVFLKKSKISDRSDWHRRNINRTNHWTGNEAKDYTNQPSHHYHLYSLKQDFDLELTSNKQIISVEKLTNNFVNESVCFPTTFKTVLRNKYKLELDQRSSTKCQESNELTWEQKNEFSMPNLTQVGHCNFAGKLHSGVSHTFFIISVILN